MLALLLGSARSGRAANLVVYTERDAAVAAAGTNKLILLLSGTASCSACAAMHSIVNTDKFARPIIDDAFVFWDCAQDLGCTSHRDYTAGENGYTLPLTCLIDPREPTHYLYRSFGGNSPAALPGVLRLAMMLGSAPIATNLVAGQDLAPGNFAVRGHTKWKSMNLSGGVLECQLDGNSFRGSVAANGTNWTCTLSNLQAGAHVFRAYFRDKLYNLGQTAEIAFTVGGGATNLPPTVSVAPATLTKPEGQDVTFTATTGGGQPAGYEWQFKASDASQFTPLVGQTNSVLLRSAVTTASAGAYRIVVWNDHGTNSASATLTVTAPDTQAPLLAITSHADFQIVATNVVRLAGTATDAGQGDNGIAAVTINGLSAINATATGASVANWSRFIGLSLGSNTFTVVAADNAGNSVTNAIRLILEPSADVLPPTVTITVPVRNQRWSNAVFLAQGTAADNVGVASVWYQLNADAWAQAVGTTSWNVQVNLAAGVNTLRACAVDAAGTLSPTNSVTFTYVVSGPLTLQTTGQGAVSPNYSNAVLELGKTYTLMAMANSGFAFGNWTAGVGGPGITNTPSLQFVMASNLVLTANFSDVKQPTLVIKAPTAGQRLSNAVATVSGTATDNLAVTAVWYQLNTNGWAVATGTSNWSAQVDLAAGANSLRACAVDAAGNRSVTNSVAFTHVASAPLILQLTGKGRISPNYSNAVLEIGKPFILTAIAGTGFVFSNWTAGVSGPVVTNKATVRFAMQSNLVLTANFIDTQRPLVAITSPKSGSRLSNSVVTVTGTASDNAAVGQVWVQLNAAVPVLAAGTTRWSNSLAPVPGPNTVQAYSVDTSGKVSLTNRLSFTWVVLDSHFVLLTNGLGTITRNFGGSVVEVGKTYTVTAVPGSGQVFSNWSGTFSQAGSLVPVATSANPLNFLMESNLTLQANFATNPFIALKGTYNGLFAPTHSEAIGATNAGYVKLTLTDMGAYSGSVLLEGATLPLGGSFDLHRMSQTTLARTGKTPLALSLQLGTSKGTRAITGMVAGGAQWQSELLTYRADSAASNTYAGAFTLLVAGCDDYGLCFSDTTNAPWGDSPAWVKVSALGAIQMAGTLADGQFLGQSTAVSEQGDWPLFVSLYGGRGFLMGWLNLDPSMPSDSLRWLMPAALAGSGYPEGISQLRIPFLNPYVAPAPGHSPMNWTNGYVVMSGGDVAGMLTNQVVLANNKLTSLPGGSIRNLTLTVTPSNGLFKGTFVHPATRKVTPINGVLQQGVEGPWPPAGGGWFLGPTTDGTLRFHAQ